MFKQANTRKHVSEHSWSSVRVIFSILAHLAHFAQSYFSLIISNWEKNRKTFFDFLSPGLGINVSLFRLGQFGEVGSELGSPGAGVEIGTG